MPTHAKTPRGARTSPQEANEGNPEVKQMRGYGFGKPIRPDGVEPQSPKSYSDIPSNKIGDTMAMYTAWREYAQNLYNEEYPKMLRAKEKYEHAKKVKLYEISGSKRLKELAAEIDVDPKIYSMKTTYLEHEVMCDMLSNKIETYGEVIAGLSREISRRQSLPGG